MAIEIVDLKAKGGRLFNEVHSYNGVVAMTRLEQLEQTIAALPVDEYRQLRNWILERDWEAWDRQIEADSASGKLDFLLKEADEEKLQGRLRPL